jgi:hypothetical protein
LHLVWHSTCFFLNIYIFYIYIYKNAPETLRSRPFFEKCAPALPLPAPAPASLPRFGNIGGVQLKEVPKLSTRAKEEMPLLTQYANKMPSSMKCFKSRCQSLQMKRLNGFSNLPVRTDGFTTEFECRNRFPAETLVFSPSCSPNSISQMNSQ